MMALVKTSIDFGDKLHDNLAILCIIRCTYSMTLSMLRDHIHLP